MKTIFRLTAASLFLSVLFVGGNAFAAIEGCPIAKQNEFADKCKNVYNGTYNSGSCKYNTNTRRYTYSCTVNGKIKTYTDRTVNKVPRKKRKSASQ